MEVFVFVVSYLEEYQLCALRLVSKETKKIADAELRKRLCGWYDVISWNDCKPFFVTLGWLEMAGPENSEILDVLRIPELVGIESKRNSERDTITVKIRMPKCSEFISRLKQIQKLYRHDYRFIEVVDNDTILWNLKLGDLKRMSLFESGNNKRVRVRDLAYGMKYFEKAKRIKNFSIQFKMSHGILGMYPKRVQATIGLTKHS